MEFVTDDTVSQIVQANGQETAVKSFTDKRLKLVVDSKNIETWEIMAIQSGDIEKALMIFSRYLCRGETAVSPDLPTEPLDELPKGEIARIKQSDAYKLLKRFKQHQLMEAVKSFSSQASAGF